MTVTVAELITCLMMVAQDAEVAIIGHCCGADAKLEILSGGDYIVVLSDPDMGSAKLEGVIR